MSSAPASEESPSASGGVPGSDLSTSPPAPAIVSAATADSHEGRKSFVLPKLTVTALRAPKARKLPPVLVTTASDAPDNETRLVAPFRNAAASSSASPRSTRRNRAVVFSDVCSAATDAPAAPTGAAPQPTPTDADEAVPVEATVATPVVASDALEGLSGPPEALAEVEDVLAILQWLSESRRGLGDDGYARGLQRLRVLSETAISSPIPVRTEAQGRVSWDAAPRTQSTATRHTITATQSHARSGNGSHVTMAGHASDGACVVLHEVIVIRLPRTVHELPLEERARRSRVMDASSAAAPALANANTQDGGDGLHAVVVLEQDLGIIAVHIVDLPLDSIPATASTSARAQANLLEVIRSQCPEAFRGLAGGEDAEGGRVAAAQTLRQLKRPPDATLPSLNEANGAQPFAALCPSFPDGKRALTYEELKAHLANTQPTITAEAHSTPRQTGWRQDTARPIASTSPRSHAAPTGQARLASLASQSAPSTAATRTRQTSVAPSGTSTRPRRRLPGTKAPQAGGFDPTHPSDTSPFVQKNVMPLAYDAEGELVLRRR